VDCAAVYLVRPDDSLSYLVFKTGFPQIPRLPPDSAELDDTVFGLCTGIKIHSGSTVLSSYTDTSVIFPNFLLSIPLILEENNLGTLILGSEEISSIEKLTDEHHQLFAYIAEALSLEKPLQTREEEISMERFSSLEDLLMILTPDGIIREVNQPFLTCSGYAYDALDGTSIFQLYPESVQAEMSARIKAMQVHTTSTFLEPILTREGYLLPVETQLSWGTWKEMKALFWISHVLPDHPQASRETLLHSAEFFRNQYENAAVPVIFFDLDGKILQANRSFLTMTDYGLEDLLHKRTSELIHYEDLQPHLRRIQHIIDEKLNHSQQYEERLISKQGHCLFTNNLLLLIRHQDNSPLYFINHIQDITSQKQVEEQLQHLATHDPLTNLPNRALLNNHFEHATTIARRQGKLVAVVYLDLDDFKLINDSYGHEIGDKVLVTVSKQLQSALRESDTIARIGGDEFVILLEGITCTRDVVTVLQKALDSISGHMEIDGSEYSITASTGFSVYPFDGNSLQQLLEAADRAMYRAKQEGVGGIKEPDTGNPAHQLGLFPTDLQDSTCESSSVS